MRLTILHGPFAPCWATPATKLPRSVSIWERTASYSEGKPFLAIGYTLDRVVYGIPGRLLASASGSQNSYDQRSFPEWPHSKLSICPRGPKPAGRGRLPITP